MTQEDADASDDRAVWMSLKHFFPSAPSSSHRGQSPSRPASLQSIEPSPPSPTSPTQVAIDESDDDDVCLADLRAPSMLPWPKELPGIKYMKLIAFQQDEKTPIELIPVEDPFNRIDEHPDKIIVRPRQTIKNFVRSNLGQFRHSIADIAWFGDNVRHRGLYEGSYMPSGDKTNEWYMPVHLVKPTCWLFIRELQMPSIKENDHIWQAWVIMMDRMVTHLHGKDTHDSSGHVPMFCQLERCGQLAVMQQPEWMMIHSCISDPGHVEAGTSCQRYIHMPSPEQCNWQQDPAMFLKAVQHHTDLKDLDIMVTCDRCIVNKAVGHIKTMMTQMQELHSSHQDIVCKLTIAIADKEAERSKQFMNEIIPEMQAFMRKSLGHHLPSLLRDIVNKAKEDGIHDVSSLLDGSYHMVNIEDMDMGVTMADCSNMMQRLHVHERALEASVDRELLHRSTSPRVSGS